MVRRRAAAIVFLALGMLALLPGRSEAQSAIGGVVKDATGAVIPGVTVEAASDVLIEKIRTVVTDGSGQYQIIDLRPGLYSVTFTLPGFNTVKRDGINLAANFTATVNAEMRVGALEETITVSGEAPVVDMRSATSQQVLSRELLDSVPTGRNVWGTGALMTGVTLTAPDVGGTRGMQQVTFLVHGSEGRDNSVQVDGMSLNGLQGDGQIQNYFNQGMFEESAYSTSALSAEVQAAGVRVNMIPKDGGNTFKGTLFSSYTPGDWQSNNFTDALKATGIRAPDRVERMFDLNPGLGGPILKNRLWFFTSWRRWGVDQAVTDSFYNLDPTHRTYRPDLTRSVIDDNVIWSGMLRLTSQLGQKHKIAGYLEKIQKYRGHECAAPVAEEACGIRYPRMYFMAQAKYTGTLSSKVLVEFGWSENNESFTTYDPQPSVKPTDIGRSDRITGERWGAPVTPRYFRSPIRHTFVGSMSYVTGSHAFKVGFARGDGSQGHQRRFNGDIDLFQEYRNGVPASVVTYNTPQDTIQYMKYDFSMYVQDSWKYKRLTVNPGFRFEALNTYIPETGSPAGRFVPYRHFDKIENFPNWRDTAPRFGIIYDIFGDGRTALKAHYGKYVTSFTTEGFAQVYDPMVLSTDRRTWTDRNGDDIAQDSEIGPINTPFNVSGVRQRNPDPDILRPYQYEANVGIQHELTRGLSVSLNWVRRNWHRLFWTRNELAGINDYTIVQVQNPVDASEMIPVYNLNVAKRGQIQQIDDNSDNNRRRYNGVDVGFTSRVGGGNIFGGVSTGKTVTVTCDVEDPNNLRFCDQGKLDIPNRTQFKLAGSYPLPFDVTMSGSWQSYPGANVNINYIVDRTVVPTLTQSSVTVPLLKPGTKFLKRFDQIDLRFGKRFQVRKVRLSAQFDIFNLLNKGSILTVTQTYGSSLDRPTSILQGRLFAVGAQMSF